MSWDVIELIKIKAIWIWYFGSSGLLKMSGHQINNQIWQKFNFTMPLLRSIEL